MTQEQIIIAVATFVIAHASTIVAAVIWAFKHVLKYNILLNEFEKEKKLREKLENDVNQAHAKIRELEKQRYINPEKSIFP